MRYTCSNCGKSFDTEDACTSHEQQCYRTYRYIIAKLGDIDDPPSIVSHVVQKYHPHLIKEEELEKVNTYWSGVNGYTVEVYSCDTSPEREKALKLKVLNESRNICMTIIQRLKKSYKYFFTAEQQLTEEKEE